MDIKENAKSLVAGFVSFDDLCRYAAHNKAEREKVKNLLRERNSKPRKQYLLGQLRKLHVEKFYLESKYSRVREKVNSEHLFII